MPDIELINDSYWLKYAADRVTNAISARDDAANKVDTYLGAVWATYTGILTAAAVFRQISADKLTIVIMALPVVILPIARYFCLLETIPRTVEFYESSPDDIREKLYVEVIKQKDKRLMWATVAAFVSALSIAASLFAFRLDQGRTKNYVVEAKYNPAIGGFVVSGFSDPDKPLTVSLAGISDTTTKQMTYYEGDAEKSGPDGRILFTVGANKIKAQLKVMVTWMDADSHPITIRN